MKAQVSLENFAPYVNQKGGQRVKFDIHRTGGRSVYGDMIFTCAGDGFVVSHFKGAAVYPEIEVRHLDMAVNIPDGEKEACKTVNVEFQSMADDSQFHGGAMAKGSYSPI